jgi:iron complex transport system ATP-binding protein
MGERYIGGVLEALDIVFGYGDQPVLRGVTLELREGEVVSLLGPNGCGKSTLIKVLLGHLAGQGKVRWAGRAVEQWPRRQLARQVAYLPQAPAFEPQQPVGDVLRLGRAPYVGAFGLESPQDLRIVREVADLLDLSQLLDRPMDALSGGQRQRVLVGRCLAQQPRAMLLDEPNTFLDLRHQVELCGLLRKLARERGIGVLMASHDLNLAATFSDRLLLMQEGRVAAEGRPGEVLEPALLERVYGVPMRRYDPPGGGPVVYPDVRM